MKSPCKNCNNRQIYCHVNCSKYADFVAQRKAIIGAKSKEAASKEFYFERIRKMKKSRSSNNVITTHKVRK